MVEQWSPKPKVGSSSLPTRAYKKIMFRIIKFIRDSYREFRTKVTWPSYEKLERLTFLFLVGVTICAALVFGMNFLLQKVQEFVYDYIKTDSSSE